MELSVLVLAVLVLGIALVLILKRPKSVDGISLDELNRLKGENERLKINEARAVERAEGLGLERERLEIKLNEINAELGVEKGRIAKAEEAFKAQRDRLNEQQEYIDKLQQQFKTEFENIANKLLEEKSNKFTEQNHKQLDIILSPFKEKLKDFEEKVEKAYKAESDERNTLKGEIKNLVELNKVMSAEAQNLTKALKGDAKKQGNWGEVVLERVLERSGLVRDREYRVQASLSGQDGNRLQPDVIIDLPDNKHLIVDSKVSLVAYERLINCESDEERVVFAKAHVESIKNHVKDLSSKNYISNK